MRPSDHILMTAPHRKPNQKLQHFVSFAPGIGPIQSQEHVVKLMNSLCPLSGKAPAICVSCCKHTAQKQLHNDVVRCCLVPKISPKQKLIVCDAEDCVFTTSANVAKRFEQKTKQNPLAPDSCPHDPSATQHGCVMMQVGEVETNVDSNNLRHDMPSKAALHNAVERANAQDKAN